MMITWRGGPGGATAPGLTANSPLNLDLWLELHWARHNFEKR